MAEHAPTSTTPDQPAPPPPPVYAVLGEFEGVNPLLKAARKVREAGYTRWECHSPFPIHGLDDVKGNPPTILPWIVLLGGLGGLTGGLLLAWWTNASSITPPVFTNLEGYPYLVSGKPIFSLLANIPVIFETTVLLSAFGAVFGMLLLNRLPLLAHPLLRNRRFRRVTDDGFFVVIEADDPAFDAERTAALLAEAGAVAVETVER